jgi:hypothetical protein
MDLEKLSEPAAVDALKFSSRAPDSNRWIVTLLAIREMTDLSSERWMRNLSKGKTMVMRGVLGLGMTLFLGAHGGLAYGAPQEVVVTGAHYGFSGIITKIASGMLFIRTETSLQPRAVSPVKADRVGLHDAKVGEPVNLLVDSGNVMIDVARTDRFFPDHRYVVGTILYADPYWREIRLSTSEGTSTFEVDPLAGTKLAGLPDGAPVTLELDSHNVMIHLHRIQ